jgi:pilus retraction protein PilT
MTMIETSLPDLTPSIDSFLKRGFEMGASDLHMSCGKRPKYRVDGDLRDSSEIFTIDPLWMRREMESIMSGEQRAEYAQHKELDFSHSVQGYGRFRVNFYIQSGTPAAVFRSIPDQIKTIDELGLPHSLTDITKKPNGLVLVTGPTGSGKSTTLAAMIEERNRNYKEHILTIEDPVEFIYSSKMALVNQREVGSDTSSFHEALRRVLRQDPDVILIGELRDPQTISIALTAAETGHLVFGTLHTQSAAKSINRIIDSFSPEQQGQIRSQLADTIQAIISQSLLKRSGGGRVAATEIMVRNTAIANQIREGKTNGIRDTIQGGRALGMHTLDQDLKRLVAEGLVTKEEAYDYLTDKETFKKGVY